MTNSVPEGKLARSGVVGLAAMKVGVGELGHRVKRPFLSAENRKKDKESIDEKNAKILFKAFTQLRGTALKVAQMVGMDQGLLPESYRKELAKSFHQVPSLNRVLVRKVMLAELEQPPETLFAQFETEAFAAASLGQVHKAVLNTVDSNALDKNAFDNSTEDNSTEDNSTEEQGSEKVAVKVQYPGINVAIKSDLTLIRGIARGLPNTKVILQSLNEVEERLMEEVDYRIEAKNTQWFQQNIKMKGIHVPRVYTDLSSERVLTTEYIEGLHLDQWLATHPSQQMKNDRAQLLYDFFIHSSRELKCLHADPNPGNYLFHEDGSITVIDFGCVRRMSDHFTDVYPRILKAYFEDDHEAVFAAYESLNMSCEDFSPAFYEKALRPFGQWISLPFREEAFDFKKNANYIREGHELMMNLHHHFKIDYLAEEFIFHNRTYYGLIQIFEKMGATVRLNFVDSRYES